MGKMNWILQLIGIVLLIFSGVTFFLPNPWWYLSIVSFILVLMVCFSSFISTIADNLSNHLNNQ